MVWKCSVTTGSKPIDPLVKCQLHFICEKCGQVYDVLVDRENEIKPARLPHRGFKVTSIKRLLRRMQTLRAVDRCCLHSSKVRDIDFAYGF